MQRLAFRMKLFHGQQEEYRRRHAAIWPELKELLLDSGVVSYSIFYDEQTDHLFGFLTMEDAGRLDELPAHPVMQRWWHQMKDIMDTNPDESPVSIPLQEVFFLG